MKANTTNDPAPQVTRCGVLDMQVCVPMEMTDEAVIEFANQANPCGTENGWTIRKEGSKYLAGAAERVYCTDRIGCVHIMLDA